MEQGRGRLPPLDPAQQRGGRKIGRHSSFSSTPAGSSPRGRARGGRGRRNAPTFNPYLLTVNAGEDVTDKLSEFVKILRESVSVISGDGNISSVVLRKPGSFSSTELRRVEGRFEILSLTGLYTFFPGDSGETEKYGTLNILLTRTDGDVFGGKIMGPMIADGPVKLVLGSFKQDMGTEVTERHAAGSSSVAAGSSSDAAGPSSVAAGSSSAAAGSSSDAAGSSSVAAGPSSVAARSSTLAKLGIELDMNRPVDLLLEYTKAVSTSGLLSTIEKTPMNVTAATTDKPPESSTADGNASVKFRR